MPYFNIVAETNENTVVSTYEPLPKRPEAYQSEAALEREFIKLLSEQGYEDKTIHSQEEMISNLRSQLERLNNYRFSDAEWQRFFGSAIANPNEHIVEKTRKIQEDNVQVLTRDDGTSKNITLIDRKNIHNNYLQVIDQFVMGKEQGAKHDNRYDVTILVNGLPLVHVELKRRGVAIREAFNQINRYQRDSSGRAAGCLSMCRYSSSPTAQTPSIIPTAPAGMPSRTPKSARRRSRRPATALSSRPFGPTPTTG